MVRVFLHIDYHPVDIRSDWAQSINVYENHTESAEALLPEAVDVARDISRTSSPALRKQVAEAIRTLLEKYFE